MDISNISNILKEVNAKYVFCLMRNFIGYEKPGQIGLSCFIPKYSIGWTDMEIKGAPESAVIPVCFLDGKTVVRANIHLADLKLIEKL